MELSSCSGPFLILDLAPALQVVDNIERVVGFQIDEDDMFRLIFDTLATRRDAIERIEEQLLCVALDEIVRYDDLVLSRSEHISEILSQVRHIAVRLYHELEGLGLYHNNHLTFAYHSRPVRNAAYFIERKHHVRDYDLR